MSIWSFLTPGTEDINYGRDTKLARWVLSVDLYAKAQVKLARFYAVESLMDLATLLGNWLEKLKGDRKGQYSIRINDKYRICFEWKNDVVEKMEIVDYH